MPDEVPGSHHKTPQIAPVLTSCSSEGEAEEAAVGAEAQGFCLALADSCSARPEPAWRRASDRVSLLKQTDGHLFGFFVEPLLLRYVLIDGLAGDIQKLIA